MCGGMDPINAICFRIVVPADSITPLATEGGATVTFIVSGRISGMNAAKKYLADTAPISRRA
jgi:hypothetical protein